MFYFLFFFLPLFFLPHEDITNRENIFGRFASTRKKINNRGPIKGGRGGFDSRRESSTISLEEGV